MSAELWRSLQKEEKKTSYQETHFLTFDRTHTPGNVSDDTKEMMKLEKGISFQIWSKKVGRIRCDQMSTSNTLQQRGFPLKRLPFKGPQEEAASSSNQNPPAKCLRPCSNWSRSPAMRRGPKHQGSDMWFIQKWYPHGHLQNQSKMPLMLGKLVNTHSRDSFKRWLALFGAFLHGFSIDMNSPPWLLQVVVSICRCCIINWISSPLRSGLTIKKWRRKSPPIYNIQLLYVYIYMCIYTGNHSHSSYPHPLQFSWQQNLHIQTGQKKEVTTFYPKRSKFLKHQRLLFQAKKIKWVRRVQIDENSIFWNLSEATLTVAQYSWKIDVWNEQHMHFI